MNNDPEVSTELHRLADAEPLTDFDTNAVLTRGRGGLRRRRFLGAGGGIAGVAAIALAATLIPNISSANQEPGVAGTENSDFSPVPGVPRGEEGAGQRLDQKEAERRCDLRYGPQKKHLFAQNGFRSARSTMYDIKGGARGGGKVVMTWDEKNKDTTVWSCTIPGGDKPSAALVAAAEADPLPTTPQGQLRNCSVDAWVDMTKWNIVVSDRLEPGGDIKGFRRGQLIAVSPSGRTAVACELATGGSPATGSGWGIYALKLDDLGTDYPRVQWPDGTFGKDMATILPEGTNCEGEVCGKSLPKGWGRAPVATAKIVVQIGSGPKYDAPVKDGWFAFTALDETPHTTKDKLTVRAYDKDGKLLTKLYPEG